MFRHLKEAGGALPRIELGDAVDERERAEMTAHLDGLKAVQKTAAAKRLRNQFTTAASCCARTTSLQKVSAVNRRGMCAAGFAWRSIALSRLRARARW